MFPAGAAAANLLGLTTQVSGRPEIATIAPSLPRNLVGKEAIVHTRRPPAWSNLSAEDAALLDLLRRGGSTCELSPADAIERVLALLSEPGRFRTLASVARSEPPRVRALLGALGERIGARAGLLKPIRESLNPLSRFDFGIFSALPNARPWQARQPRPRETPPPPRL
jgi:hypothetical protein